MVVNRIHLNNFKIFEGLNTISFPDPKTPVVFVGVNGAGKTTIMEAITGCLWEFYHKLQDKKIAKDERFSRSNINIYAEEFSEVTLEWEDLNFQFTTGFEIRKTVDPEYKFIGSETILEYIKTLKGDVGFYKNESRISIVVFYPVERSVLNPSLKSKSVEKGNQFDSLDNAFDKSVNFNNFFEWFRSTEDLENEIRLNKNNSYSDKGLDVVRKAILIFLENFSKIRVRRTPYTTLVLEKNNEEFEVNQLSHGEKVVIAMIGDLARRLVIANPGSINALNGEGIVLIDEIDLHLHPKWQRTILKKLKDTFPNIQFICTTHSPLVINHLKKESIYLLDNGKCIPLSNKYIDFNTYGADIEDILILVQGTEDLIPSDIKDEFNNLFNLINSNLLDKASSLIIELKRKTDPDHPKIKKAETQINYKKLLSK